MSVDHTWLGKRTVTPASRYGKPGLWAAGPDSDGSGQSGLIPIMRMSLVTLHLVAPGTPSAASTCAILRAPYCGQSTCTRSISRASASSASDHSSEGAGRGL